MAFNFQHFWLFSFLFQVNNFTRPKTIAKKRTQQGEHHHTLGTTPMPSNHSVKLLGGSCIQHTTPKIHCLEITIKPSMPGFVVFKPPTHLKDMRIKLDHLPPIFGEKIPKIFELPPPGPSKLKLNKLYNFQSHVNHKRFLFFFLPGIPSAKPPQVCALWVW